MKKMNYKHNLFVVSARKLTILMFVSSFLINLTGLGQTAQHPDALYTQAVPNMLILKIKDNKRIQWEQYLQNNTLSEDFKVLLGETSVKAAFPNHKPLESAAKSVNPKLVDLSLFYKLNFQKDFPLDALKFRLNRTGFFEYTEEIYPTQALFIPNDEKLGNQYYLGRINAYQAWDISQGDTNTVIGIVDSGTDLDHPDLMDNTKYNYNDPIDGIDNDNDGFVDNFMGWDMGDMDNNPQVIAGGSNPSHGVHMCGIAAASTNNALGIAGVGNKCKFLPVKINDINNDYIAGFEGIVYAADHGCKVINCSWGGQQYPGKYGQDIINYATFNKDALVVAACGNSNSILPFWPASYENVLSVGGSGPNDERMFVNSNYASSYGYYLDLCAPGSGIFSTWDYPYFYNTLSGTSMAAAVTSGAAALVRSHFPGLSALQTAEKLRATADIIDTLPSNAGLQGLLGSGRINLYKALVDSVTPSLRIIQSSYSDEGDSVFRPGDTLQLTASFYNFLFTAHNVNITLHCVNSGVQMLDSVYSVNQIPASSPINNQNLPFRFVLNNTLASDAVLMFKLDYQGDNFHSFEYIRLDLNADFMNVTAGAIHTTLTSKGKIGYNDDFRLQGNGFSYQNDISRLYSGGFSVGINYFQVSDALYNSTFTAWDNDFLALEKIHAIIPSSRADHEYRCIFSDDAASDSIGLTLTHTVLSWDQSANSKFLIHELIIKNNTSHSLANLYAGLFADWDINDQQAFSDYVNWDNLHKIGITSSHAGGPLMGISLITNGPVKHYAFDNDGANGSIKINDGFTPQEKYTSLKSSRSQAGTTISGNNVSDQVSTGPFLVLPGDSVVVAFAMLSADHLTDLLAALQQAKDKYFNLNAVENINSESPGIYLLPNPVSNNTTLYIKVNNPGAAIIKIFDLSGKELSEISTSLFIKDWNTVDLPSENFNSGIFFVQVLQDGNAYWTKLIKD